MSGLPDDLRDINRCTPAVVSSTMTSVNSVLLPISIRQWRKLPNRFLFEIWTISIVWNVMGIYSHQSRDKRLYKLHDLERILIDLNEWNVHYQFINVMSIKRLAWLKSDQSAIKRLFIYYSTKYLCRSFWNHYLIQLIINTLYNKDTDGAY